MRGWRVHRSLWEAFGSHHASAKTENTSKFRTSLGRTELFSDSLVKQPVSQSQALNQAGLRFYMSLDKIFMCKFLLFLKLTRHSKLVAHRYFLIICQHIREVGRKKPQFKMSRIVLFIHTFSVQPLSKSFSKSYSN